ncbi:MAG: dTMP kinase [Planctomycetia bacterium]|nr:dTMP kinase [Planctomycetia bacterium]
MFFSFDGIDGVGKSTQLDLFSEWLRTAGHKVVSCRDPGSTELGESIRGILLNDFQTPICRPSEMLLYMAARAQMVEQVIRPALAAGQVVVSDRFLLANVAYQGYAGGMDVDTLWSVGQVATGGLEPDLTFVLDMPLDKAAARMQRELDRMELQGDRFRELLRAGYLAEAARRPEKIAVIDASGPVPEVQNQIRQAASRFVKPL